MLILQGSETFWHEFFQQDSSEDETKYNAGLYLRTIFNKIASVSQEELEEDIFPGEPKQGAEHTDSHTHPKTPETQEIEGKEKHNQTSTLPTILSVQIIRLPTKTWTKGTRREKNERKTNST